MHYLDWTFRDWLTILYARTTLSLSLSLSLSLPPSLPLTLYCTPGASPTRWPVSRMSPLLRSAKRYTLLLQAQTE